MFMNLFMYFYTIFCIMFISSFVNVIWVDKDRLSELEIQIDSIKFKKELDSERESQLNYIELVQEKNLIMFPKKFIKFFLLVTAIIAIRKIALIEPLYLFGFKVGFIITILVAMIIGYVYNLLLKKLGVRM